jgi:outer membrane lipoprotein SlyB
MKTLRSRSLAIGTLLASVLALSGCRDALSGMFSRCDSCGTIESITPRRVQGDVSGGGAVAGAIIGGVVGHQFGSGSGNTAATVAGAAGGAVAGNEVEKRRKQDVVYDITVKMEKGELVHVTVPSRDNLNPGDRVEVVDGRLVRSDRPA